VNSSPALAKSQAIWPRSLPGCALVISARLRGFGVDAGWVEVILTPFDTVTAWEQSAAELGPPALGWESRPALAEALGCLQLALHLAAGVCAWTTEPRRFSSVCELRIWHSPEPIRRIPPFASAVERCSPIPSSCRSRRGAERGCRRKAMARGVLGARSCAGGRLWREPRRCDLGSGSGGFRRLGAGGG
jgi:hypothetical protein